MNAFSVLTPYIVPPSLQRAKAVNLGDGFILDGIERRLGPFAAGATFSNRTAPSPEAFTVLSNSRGLVLAGANQLNDNFAPWPGATADQIRALATPVIPFGIGLHGNRLRAVGMSPAAKEMLEAIHERLEYSAWRCPLTVSYLRRELPHLVDRFLMTGCPVTYDDPVLERSRVEDENGAVAVTVTDREDFWTRETDVLDTVADLFPSSRRAMVLQQDFVLLGRSREKGTDPAHDAEALRAHARRRGYEVIAPRSAGEALETYRAFGLHIGSRVHVHLRFLSQNKRSLLIPVDDRARGFADAYGFPLGTPQSIDKDLHYDFEAVRSRIREAFETMRRFEATLTGRLAEAC